MALSVRMKRIVAAAKKYPWLFAFAASVTGALWQWSTTNAQERTKYESGLIAKALEEKDSGVVAEKLRLLLELQLVRSDQYANLERWANNPDDIPGFAGAAIRDKLISFSRLKLLLKNLGRYDGDMEDRNSPELRRAIAQFQFDNDLPPDGLVGPKTLQTLMKVSPALRVSGGW